MREKSCQMLWSKVRWDLRTFSWNWQCWNLRKAVSIKETSFVCCSSGRYRINYCLYDKGGSHTGFSQVCPLICIVAFGSRNVFCSYKHFVLCLGTACNWTRDKMCLFLWLGFFLHSFDWKLVHESKGCLIGDEICKHFKWKHDTEFFQTVFSF